MNSLMITPQKKELQKQKIPLHGLMSLVLLCLCLVCPLSSNASDGVNSNTVTSGTTVTTSTGNPTSETVTNEDGSETTTTTTPTTTTTTTTTVTQTEVDNVVSNPNFTNSQGGGSSADWTLEACGGNGCAFGPTHGFRTSYGTGTISQTQTAEDMGLTSTISAEEAGQGFTFSFGADVRNNFKNQIGGDYSQGGTTDTWSIKLEVFDAADNLLGEHSIGVTGGANIGTQYQTNQTETGTLHIDSGNIVSSGTITLSGVDNGYWGGWYGPRFKNIFTTFLYNEIERTITTSTSYTDLVTIVSCEVLETCIQDIVQDTLDSLTNIATDVVDTTTESAELEPPVIEIELELDTPTTQETSSTTETQTVELEIAPVAPPEITAPVEMPQQTQMQAEAQVAEVEIEAEIEAETTVAVEVKVEEPKGEVSGESNTSDSKETTENSSEEGKESSDNVGPDKMDKGKSEEADGKGDSGNKGADKPQPKKVVVKKISKKEMKEKVKEAKQKVAKKIIKKMGDKGRYEGGNQLKTLVVMQVLGNSREFFSTQAMIPDTPNFFSADRIPDNTIADNNRASYFMFGGSDAAHNALVDSQYK